MQTNLFGEIEKIGLNIEKAAKVANVSTATIRNWVKTGYLESLTKGQITHKSLSNFMENIAGKKKLNSRTNKLLKNNHNHNELTNKVKTFVQNYNNEEMGIEYENALSNSYKNKEGIYYTPSWIVKDMLNNLSINADYKFLDPCCGSGNFIIEAIRAGVSPENVYGFDVDDNAVYITKERIRSEFGFETNNIKVGDFFEQVPKLLRERKSFDLIFTNPPWGKKLSKTDKEKYAKLFNCGNSLDTTSLFMGASFMILSDSGILGFLVQEAFFNITTFEDIRNKVLNKEILRFVDYGKAFKGLITRAQSILIKNCPAKENAEIKCSYENATFDRTLNSFKNNPKNIFNFWANEFDSQTITRLFKVPHITLANKAKWALGIVTGNNEKYCTDKQRDGCIPIFIGSDITKSGLKPPSHFISNQFQNFQQVAPLEMYQADEKLIYKFISSNLCFYYDDKQRFILNSANLLIPLSMGISTKQLADLLNSDIINWLFKKLFATHKVLRGDLELLPIHTEYFKNYSEYSEESYLHYLQIKKEQDGTFRIKN